MVIADNPDGRRVRTPSVAFALLGLLLVFLSSVTYQQTTAPRVGLGFVGPLDYLVVAGHHETLRVLSSDADTDSGDGPTPDFPGWPGQSSHRQPQRGASEFIQTGTTVAVPQPGRYLRPHLRAPPLA